MIIKKDYGEYGYIVLDVKDIEYDINSGKTQFIGTIIDQKDCEDFLDFEEVVLNMNKKVEIIKL